MPDILQPIQIMYKFVWWFCTIVFAPNLTKVIIKSKVVKILSNKIERHVKYFEGFYRRAFFTMLANTFEIEKKLRIYSHEITVSWKEEAFVTDQDKKTHEWVM